MNNIHRKSGLGKKVLVIDDDHAIVESIQMLLEMDDYEVATMFDGGKLDQVSKISPDLILLDIWMSGQDGRDVARYLKSREGTRSIPIIMVSASKDIEKSAIESGADDFLPKPFEADDLLMKVKEYIS